MFEKNKYLYGNLDKELFKDIKKEILFLSEITKKEKVLFLKKLKNRLMEKNVN